MRDEYRWVIKPSEKVGPVPIDGMELLSALEAGIFLRLDGNGKDDAAVVAAVDRIVATGKLRPCKMGGRRCYTRRELNRFIDAATEEYVKIRPKDS